MSDPLSNISSIADFVANNNANYGTGLQNFANLMPRTDPTMSSGYNYARSIAGGLPMEQVIAPGVSYSPDQPGGFTQAQLGPVITDLPNIVTDSPPDDAAFLPGGSAVNAPNYGNLPLNIIGGGMGDNITILQDEMRFPPPIDILGGFNFVPQIDQDILRQNLRDEILSEVPISEVPIQDEILERPMIAGLEDRNLMDVDALLGGGGPTGGIFSIENIREDIREDLPILQEPDLSKVVTQKDINDAISQINIPPVSQGLLNLQTPQVPTGGRFSIDRITPGLFK
jgi:hypothetical protein